MTALQPLNNTLAFWNRMMLFNPKYYYYMLTEDQIKKMELDIILRTFTRMEIYLIRCIKDNRDDQYNTVFPILTQYIITPVSSIIYEYYTINKEQRRTYSLGPIYRTLTLGHKDIIRDDLLNTRNNVHRIVYNAVPQDFHEDIADIIYDYL
jgi:hypothetical protein